MASIHEVPTLTGDEVDLGLQFDTSSANNPQKIMTKFSLDLADDGDVVDDIYSKENPPRPGFTRFDQKDMYRMGKIQKFKVSNRSEIEK